MGREANVKKDRLCRICGKTVPAADGQALMEHSFDCLRRKKLSDTGLILPDAPTGQLIEV